jgi:hypothetical protein
MQDSIDTVRELSAAEPSWTRSAAVGGVVGGVTGSLR